MDVSKPPLELSMLADAVSDGVILFDEHDRVVFVNRAARALLELDDEHGVLGLSSHNVFMGHLRASGDALSRMRTGDEVRVRAGGQSDDDFAARFVQFPLRAGTGAAAGYVAQEPPTAIVIRDRRAVARLRRLEDARIELREDRGGGSELLGPHEILRTLGRELRRAARDHEPLAVVVVSAPQGLDLATFDAWLTGTLRGPDRAGRLQTRAPVNTLRAGGAPPLRVVDETVDLNQDRLWACVSLPTTNETGAYAVALRLAALAREAGIREVEAGVATYVPSAEDDDDQDAVPSPVALLRRAVDRLRAADGDGDIHVAA